MLKDINELDISFIFGDSCGEVDRPGRNEPFLKDELMRYISSHDNAIELLLKNVRHGMIEAHLWNDKYITELVK